MSHMIDSGHSNCKENVVEDKVEFDVIKLENIEKNEKFYEIVIFVVGRRGY